MNLETILKIIPELFMYFIPGFITLSIRRKFRHECSYNDRDLLVLSIVLSFIYDKILFVLFFIISKLFYIVFKINLESLIPSIINIENSEEWYIILVLLLSVIFGYILTVFPDTDQAVKIRRIFKSNAEPYATVWNYAMRNQNGAWARVYLRDEDVGYVGKLLKYTCNPDRETREVYLSCFTSFKISTNEEIENNENDEKSCVYIDATRINRIEIIKD